MDHARLSIVVPVWSTFTVIIKKNLISYSIIPVKHMTKFSK